MHDDYLTVDFEEDYIGMDLSLAPINVNMEVRDGHLCDVYHQTQDYLLYRFFQNHNRFGLGVETGLDVPEEGYFE